MSDLGRRAVACKGWRWMPGMACVSPEHMPNTWYRRIGDERSPAFPFLLPDLEDPATLGGLLALAREAWRGPTLFVCTIDSEVGPRWMVASDTGAFGESWPSEAEALVVALEAAQ